MEIKNGRARKGTELEGRSGMKEFTIPKGSVLLISDCYCELLEDTRVVSECDRLTIQIQAVSAPKPEAEGSGK